MPAMLYILCQNFIIILNFVVYYISLTHIYVYPLQLNCLAQRPYPEKN